MPAEVINACEKLKFIDIAFTGVDHVAMEAVRAKKIEVRKVIIYLFIAIVIVLVMFPLVYTFFGSFKSNAELLTNAHKVLPEKFQTSNYANAWKSANFAQYTWNSLAMAVPIVIGTIFSLTTAAYVFERGHFPGKKLLFLIITSSMFISLGSLTLYPLFKITKFFSIFTRIIFPLCKPLMLAGTTISLIPIIVVYIFFNRLFIDGLTSGAVKG